MTIPTIKIRRLYPEHDSDIPLPRYMTPQSSGMDLCAAIKEDQVLPKGSITVIPTGIAIALPPDLEAQIRPRSGLAFKHGIGIINSPGTIDSDYRGEVKVGLINLFTQSYLVEHGDRIAQMVISKLPDISVEEVEELDDTERGEGGFGSTGDS